MTRDRRDVLNWTAKKIKLGDNNHIDKATLVQFYVSLQAVITLLQATNNAHFKAFYNMKRG